MMKYLLAILMLLTVPATAHDMTHEGIVIDHPIMHPALGNPTMTVGYMRLLNKTDHADRLVAVRSDIADRIEIHTHIMDGEIMRMRRVDGVEVPANGKVAFAPGGYHLMIFGLREKLIVGEEIPVELEFERAGTVTAPFWVEARTAPAPADEMKHDGHDGHGGHH